MMMSQHIVLKEYLIDSDLEPVNVSKMYFKQISKIMNGDKSGNKKSKQQ